jgi:hypothetical protein
MIAEHIKRHENLKRMSLSQKEQMKATLKA